MHDPFRLPRRMQREAMADRRFATRHGPLRIWAGMLPKDGAAGAHLDVEQDTYTAIWLLRGETRYIDGEYGDIRVAAGDLLCRLPNRRHSTIPVAGSGLVEFFIHIDTTWSKQLSALGAIPDRPHGRLGWDPGLAERCLSYLDRLARLPDAAWPVALAEAQALLAAFAVGAARGGAADPAMDEACALLAADLPGRLGLRGVARRLGIGVEAFRKRFTVATGESPGAWRIRRRVDAACARLLAGDQPLVDVAAELGYADVPTFAKQFRRVTGQPPAAWRRAQRGLAAGAV